MEQITVESLNEPLNEPGSLTIHFEGICTHILQGPTVPLPVARRIVLVHAEERKHIHGHSIPPHRAFLKVDALDLQSMKPSVKSSYLDLQPDNSWQIKGARIRVHNPLLQVGDPKPAQPIPSMPSLMGLTPGLGPLSQDVVFKSDAACHFDVNEGVFSGIRTDGGSFDSILTVATNGCPVLIIEDITKPPGTSPSILLTLNSGATITISNVGMLTEPDGDTPYDFLLHYLVLQCIPADPGVPPEKFMRTDFDGLGPGCSNSNYP